jgi:hypothetical protein
MSSTVHTLLRFSRGVSRSITRPALSRRALGRLGGGGALLLGGLFLASRLGGPALPDDVQGTVVFVSDRSGVDSLYVRRLPDGKAERLVALDEPIAEPGLSPDGKRVAFSVGGRIGIADLTGAVRILTHGTEWKDTQPSWRADGQALFITARHANQDNHDIHELVLAPGPLARRAVLETPYLDESSPVAAPAGRHVVFIREDSLYRVDAADGRPRRLTGGFRKVRSPRFLSSGRVVFHWREGKEFGLDSIDLEGRERETLHRGTTYYRQIAPSPDGRFLLATFTYDLSFHLSEAVNMSQREELRLLDSRGQPVTTLAGAWRYANHTADWGR